MCAPTPAVCSPIAPRSRSKTSSPTYNSASIIRQRAKALDEKIKQEQTLKKPKKPLPQHKQKENNKNKDKDSDTESKENNDKNKDNENKENKRESDSKESTINNNSTTTNKKDKNRFSFSSSSFGFWLAIVGAVALLFLFLFVYFFPSSSQAHSFNHQIFFSPSKPSSESCFSLPARAPFLILLKPEPAGLEYGSTLMVVLRLMVEVGNIKMYIRKDLPPTEDIYDATNIPKIDTKQGNEKEKKGQEDGGMWGRSGDGFYGFLKNNSQTNQLLNVPSHQLQSILKNFSAELNLRAHSLSSSPNKTTLDNLKSGVASDGKEFHFFMLREKYINNYYPSSYYLQLQSSNWFFSSEFCIATYSFVLTPNQLSEEQTKVKAEKMKLDKNVSSQPSFLVEVLRSISLLLLPIFFTLGVVFVLYFRNRTDANAQQLSIGSGSLSGLIFIVGFFFCGWLFIFSCLIWCGLVIGSAYYLFSIDKDLGSLQGTILSSTSKSQGSAPVSLSKIEETEIENNSRVSEMMSIALKQGSFFKVECPFDWVVQYEDLVLIEKCGSGSFGEVWKGEWNSQEVAIKNVRIPMSHMDKNLVDAFRDEVIMMSKLRHPHVLLFMGACIQPPHLSIVTEWCENGTLYDYFHNKTSQELRFEELLEISKQIAIGMNYLHHKNVLHRDLKSTNILIDKYKNAKVADFGLSTILEKGKTTRDFVGTPNWMAPEVLRLEEYTEKADVFSYGVIIWEMVTKKLPFENLNRREIAEIVGRKAKREVIPPGTNPKVARLIRDCWIHLPKRRPDFSEIVDRIKNFDKIEEPEKGGKKFLSSVNSLFQGMFQKGDL